MASYVRLGPYLLSSEIAADPAGRIHRGLSLTGSTLDRHLLIRTFTEEVIEAGFSARTAEVERVAGLLAGVRGFGANYRVEGGRVPNVACDHIPGRSLAQVLRKTRDEQIPLGVDHSLSVIQGLAQSLLALDARQLHHGTLSPHSIWVSFEGATHVIDAPYAGVLQSLLPRARTLEAALAPYRAPAQASALQQDLFALGSILFELLTLDKVPGREQIPAALAAATLKAAQEEGPIPGEIAALLKRVLLDTGTFETVGAFNKELERVLYDGDYSPTTFNMAFFMHTLFREESDQDGQAMKADQGADFTPFLPSEPGSRSMLVAADGSGRGKLILAGVAVVVVLFAFMGYNLHLNTRRNEDLQAKIADLQRDKAANDNRLLDLAKQEDAQRLLQEQLTRKASEARTVEEKAKARKDLEEAKAKSTELSRQKDEALRKQQELASASQSIVAAAQPAAPRPVPAAPAPEAPARQEAPAPAPAPAPAAQAPAPAPAPAPVADIPESAATMTSRVSPMTPRIANKAMLPAGIRDQEVKVDLKVFVDAQGRPVKVVILQGVAGPFGFNDAAQNAALASTYAPATRNGKAVASWMTLEYNFGKVR